MANIMPSEFGIRGTTSDALPAKIPGGMAQSLLVNPFGHLKVVQALPPRADIVRLGYSFAKLSDAAIEAVDAVPTTTAACFFWNGNLATGRSAIIDRIVYTGSAAAGAAGIVTMLANLTQTALTAQPSTACTATAIISLNCGAVNNGAASSMKTSKAVTVVDNGHFALGQSTYTSTAGEENHAVIAQIDGLIILPPGHGISLDIYQTTAGNDGSFTMFWHEMVL